jgi:hypothetical protein
LIEEDEKMSIAEQKEYYTSCSPKVLLLLPPLYQSGREPDYNPKEPMSLMVLASELRRRGIGTRVLDADVEALPLEQTVDRILQQKPKVLGISALQRALPSVERVVREIRKEGLEGTHITLGGIPQL